MAVYLFTLHAYRSWNPDNPRGYVRRGEGILQPDSGMAKAYDLNAVESPVRFTEFRQRVIGWIAYDCCTQRGWRLHAIAIIPSHAHVLMSWTDETHRGEVFKKLKNLMSWALNQKSATHRKHWFSRGGSKQCVKDHVHFDHLMRKYLPGHNGCFWREGMEPPCEPEVSPRG